jgi:hypothetical protein
MTGRRVEVSAYALELGRLDTSSCQRVKYASSGAILMSAKAPDIDRHQRRDLGDCEAVPRDVLVSIQLAIHPFKALMNDRTLSFAIPGIA